MIDPKKLISDLLGSTVPGTQGTVRDTAGQVMNKAKENPLATGAILAAMLGTGIGRELTGSALKLGGAAAVAGLAYKAYQNYQAGKTPEVATPSAPEALPPVDGTDFEIVNDGAGKTVFALSLVRIMIAAARADGHVDDAERAAILDRLRLSGINQDIEAFLAEELSQPTDLDGILAAAQSEPEKVELYTAARIAIDPDTRAERGFLDLLAGRLGLADPLVDHIDATVAGAKSA